VSVTHQHTKLITATAREILRPMGVTQKGRSRLWFDDHGWWVGLVEFQPSGFRRGSYLNAGVQWLWDELDWLGAFMYPRDFDVRPAIDGQDDFIKYESDEQFSPLVEKMVRVAAERINHFRKLFPTIEVAAQVLRKCKGIEWDLDAGIALGLVGDRKSAHKRFAAYLEWDASEEGQSWRSDWDEAEVACVKTLNAEIDDTDRFRAMIGDTIRSVRAALKLGDGAGLPF
jgi:hypothetical protein